MNHLIRRSLCLCCFILAAHFCWAQPVVTEYYVMKSGFKIDLTDKKIQKTVYVKGVVDIVWSTSNSTLSITYDPHLTSGADVMKAIQDVTGLNNAGIQATKAK
jgi:hypothetical protein